MDNDTYNQLLVTKANIEARRQDSDEKMKKLTEKLTAIIASMMDQTFFNTHQTIRIPQRLRILPLWSRLTGRLQHWKMGIF